MTVSMEQHLKQLAASMLNLASDKFSNHGCNDFEDGLFSEWTKEEKAEFMTDAADWNNGFVEGEPEDLPDWMVMAIIAHSLTKDF